MMKKLLVTMCMLSLIISGLFAMVLTTDKEFIFNAGAETWTETTSEEFTAGETAFIDIEYDSMELTTGINLISYYLGEAYRDSFGSSVCNAGDVNGDGYDDIIAGSQNNDDGGADAGKAYVYFGSERGILEKVGWTGIGESASDYYGHSVAGVGDVNGDGYDDILVGAHLNDKGGTNAGKIYLYFGSKFGPSKKSGWTAMGEAANDYFGYSIAGAGDVNSDGYDDILVGAYYNDGSGVDAGEAYLYFGGPGGPRTSPDWSDQGEAAGDNYGFSVSGAGDVNADGIDDIIIGAYLNADVDSGAGKAYVYFGTTKGPSGNPSWSGLGEDYGDLYGFAVSGGGDVNGDGYDDILVSARDSEDNGIASGEAYLYFGSAAGPATVPDWDVEGENIGDYFGAALSLAGDLNGDGLDDFIIGAWANDDTVTNAGKVYVYFGSSYGLSIEPDWIATGTSKDDHFGNAVSGGCDFNGDGRADLIVGEYSDDNIAVDAGKVYVFGIPLTDFYQSWVGQGEASTDLYSLGVSGAGDVNGDGIDDLLVGAYGNSDSAQDAGEAYVYFGSSIGPSATPDWSDQGGAMDDHYGFSLSGAGDVNGDGYDDIIIGAFGNDSAGYGAGKAYVYYGSASGPSATPDWSDEGEAAGDSYAYAVSGAGDVNGDGYDDVVVGAYNNDGAGANAGEVYVYYGSSGGLSKTPSWSDQGEATVDYFGYSLAGAGDVNGDGYDDIVVGAYGNDGNGSNSGEAYIYFGSSTGPSATPDWSDLGEANDDQFGYRVSGAGDVNGDGYDDIMVGAWYNDDGGNNAGKSYVYFGSDNGPSATPDWSAVGEAAAEYFGKAIAGAGDVNNDGFDDIMSASVGNKDVFTDRGKVFLYYGSAVGPSTAPNWSDVGEAAGDYFGYTISSAGDVNGDGYDAIIIGAYGNKANLGSNTGEAYVYTRAHLAERGRFISDTYSVDGVESFNWVSIEWNRFPQPPGTSVKCQIATNNGGSIWNFVGPDGTGNTYFTHPPGEAIYSDQTGRFIKVRIYLLTSIGSRTPIIDDYSVNYAQFEYPSVTVTSPNGGEDWMKGDFYPITWNAEGELNSTPVQLFYSTDNGAGWTPIASWIANTGYYNWTVPSVDTPGALIRVSVTDTYGNTASDTSDASFAIDPPPPSISGGGSDYVLSGNEQEQVEEPENAPDTRFPSDTKAKVGDSTNSGNTVEMIVIITALILTLLIHIFLISRRKGQKTAVTTKARPGSNMSRYPINRRLPVPQRKRSLGK